MYLEGSHNVRLTVEEVTSCGMRRSRGGDSTYAIHLDASHTAGLIDLGFIGILR